MGCRPSFYIVRSILNFKFYGKYFKKWKLGKNFPERWKY